MVTELDSVNRKIITLLQNKPGLTQAKVAKTLGISQSAVASRLRKLNESKVFTPVLGLDLYRVGLQMSRVDVSTSSTEAMLNFAKSCPLCVNASSGVGDRNVSLLFAAEDIEMFQYIVDGHIRTLEGATEVSFAPILSWANGFAARIPLDVPRSTDPPCGSGPYCPRCPANPDYDGRVFDGASENGDVGLRSRKLQRSHARIPNNGRKKVA